MILPKSTPEQRFPFYEDVESLINVGFLSHSIDINGVSLNIRSLNPGDTFLLKSRVGRGTDSQWQNWAIASTIWMIDGYLVLGDSQAPAFLYPRIRDLPSAARDILFSQVMCLHHRQTRAIKAAEAYCFESASRFKWKAYKSGPVNSHTGVPGSERLGLNHVQQIWSVFNEVEDIRREEESMWEGMKLVASAHAPKGIKKIDDADQMRRASEDERRQQVMDKFFYTLIGVFTEEGKPREDGPQYISKHQSADDLAEEMYNWVTGKEDWHDRFVREYKERLIANYRKEKKEAAERARALRLAQEDESGNIVPLVGYSPDQLSELLKNREQGPLGARKVFDDPDRDSVYLKYVVGKLDSGRLQAVNGRLIVKDGDAQKGEPERPPMPNEEY